MFITKYIPKQLYFVKSKVIFLFWYLGFCPRLYFFCDRRSTFRYAIATKKLIYSINSDTLRERLHLGFNLINYLTCKTTLAWFSTNFILALFGSLTLSACNRRECLLCMACSGKKNNKKLTNLKIFSIYLNNYILSKIIFLVLLFVGTSPHTPSSFVSTKNQKACIYCLNLGYVIYLISIYLI